MKFHQKNQKLFLHYQKCLQKSIQFVFIQCLDQVSKQSKGQNIISVPIKDAKKELTVAKSLFEGANFVTIDAVEHDKKIAVILGLTHLMNLVFANIVSKDEKMFINRKNVRYNISEFKKHWQKVL